jgi:hypothetical protein
MPYIRLKVYNQGVFVSGRTQGYRMKVEVEEAQGLSPNIFVFQRYPGTDDAGNPNDTFTNIASPADLQEYPSSEPVDSANPFFRLAEVTLDFRTDELAQAALARMQSDVEELIQSLEFMEDLQLSGEWEYGSSSSSSSSE